MSYTCSLSPLDSMKHSYSSQNPYTRSVSSLSTISGGTTVRHKARRHVSAGSHLTISSFPYVLHSGPTRSENASRRAISPSLLSLVEGAKVTPRPVSSHASRNSSWGTDTPPSRPLSQQPSSYFDKALIGLREIDLNTVRPADDEISGAAIRKVRPRRDTRIQSSEIYKAPDVFEIPEEIESDTAGAEEDTGIQAKPTLKRWMSTLRRRNHKRESLRPPPEPWQLELLDLDQPTPLVPWLTHHGRSPHQHRKSSSGSSFPFLTAIRSATHTIASTGMASSVLRGRTSLFRSSEASNRRTSLDGGSILQSPVVDEATWMRSVRRHKILEEMLATEESYIADLKALSNVYFTMLGFQQSQTDIPAQTRNSLHETVNQILQLHVDLLAELQAVIPNSDTMQGDVHGRVAVRRPRHARWHSVDEISSPALTLGFAHTLRHSIDLIRPGERSPGLAANTATVAAVAKVFLKFGNRFLIYEAYNAHQHIMTHDEKTFRMNLDWQTYERGVEALSHGVMPITQQKENGKKSSMFGDLIMKPIQRPGKYNLLFKELCRQTPVCDDPEAHEELENTVLRLEELNGEINTATCNEQTRSLVEKTWLLQDRLAFMDQDMSRAAIFRLLGHVVLCGVLHTAYTSQEQVEGAYMICILYRSCLLLAKCSKSTTTPEPQHSGRPSVSYEVLASISLANACIEDPDNGRGLQCHTAPYTWKLVFLSSHRQYELILSACSDIEESTWRAELQARIQAETATSSDGRPSLSFLVSPALDLRPLIPVLGKHGGPDRRVSINRAATLGPKNNLPQVVIKNTAAKTSMGGNAKTSVQVGRSQSLLAPSHIPVLAPRRSERQRLEALVEDVWTTPTLPFPGMSARRMENPIRAGANHVMRKLSMVSIASNFSKRSASYASIASSYADDRAPNPRKRPHTPTPQANRPVYADSGRRDAASYQKDPVNPHTSGEAFFPPDFELTTAGRPAPSSRKASMVSVASYLTTLPRRGSPTVAMDVPRPASSMGFFDGCNERDRLAEVTNGRGSFQDVEREMATPQRLRTPTTRPPLRLGIKMQSSSRLDSDPNVRRSFRTKLKNVFKPT